MVFTETTSVGWGSRLMSSIKGILIGLILIAVAVVALFWNEGRAVKRAQDLAQGRGAVVEGDVARVDPAQEGALLHLTGEATTDATLADPDFDVALTALRLRRVAEMYQWVERTETKTRQKVGGGQERVTNYHYDRNWSASLVDSTQFKTPTGHENPRTMPVTSNDWTAERVTLGAFTLAPALKGKLSNYQPLPMEALPPAESKAMQQFPNLQISSGGYYIGANPSSPAVGDIRVNFEVVKPQVVSVVAGQKGQSLDAWKARNSTVALLGFGEQSADDLFTQAETENVIILWIIRVVGFMFIFFGFRMLMEPFAVLADVLPFMGSLVRVGTSIVAFLLALPLALFVIALGWLWYRPLLGIALLVVAVGSLVMLWRLAASKKPGPVTAPNPVLSNS